MKKWKVVVVCVFVIALFVVNVVIIIHNNRTTNCVDANAKKQAQVSFQKSLLNDSWRREMTTIQTEQLNQLPISQIQRDIKNIQLLNSQLNSLKFHPKVC